MVAVAAAVGGWRLGLLTRAASWIGLGLGLLLALRVLPWILEWQKGAPHDRLVILTLVVLFGAAMGGQAIGYWIGRRWRPDTEEQRVATAFDRVLGAVAGTVGVLALVWLTLPLLGQATGWPAEQARGSAVVRFFDEHLPAPPDSMAALRALAGEENFPVVFDVLRPTPDYGPPPPETGLSEATAATTARSVLKVEGIACNRVQDGTGFVAAPGVVVTNAHVVAGEPATEVVRDDGVRLPATVVAFDPAVDLAVLSVPEVGRPPLPIGESVVEASGGVFGHPGGGPLRIAPFRVARLLDAVGRDIYGTGVAYREVLELSAALLPGDSGSPLVAADGRVVGVAFAVAPDRTDVAYALTVTELRQALEGAGTVAVPTGACTR